ncbi:DNA primase [Mangrovimicrobium sediminis]|uniref:DNA primase n=1 Tax=Mangrovimicrobium sediminis TaxID=2562682 RepID=A0A4Z0LZA7_9GAMM|nr:DNA primase [Haliea sp. SAOS-164]TGD72497.1 DNA primase [Haliea sp. SAOS-164]
MAGRIPQAFLDELLDRLDIVEVIDRRVKLKKSGKNYTARCPFHEEKTPSFSVNPDKQFYYCFGCGAGGNALGFVMDYENLEFPRAVEALASSVGLEVPRESTAPGQARREEEHRSLYKLLEEAASFYKQQLRQHPQKNRPVDYLKGRGLTGEIARQFDLGFAPPGWDNLLQALGKDEATRKLLADAGMLVENDQGRVYDRFRDRIVFPIRDQRGRVIAFGGRVLGDDKPKYLNSPETAVFHKGRELYGFYQVLQANRNLQRILVVEGYMDVIALFQHGITFATATLGTATSTAHLERIFRRCPEVIFCFDGDTAGRRAASRAMEAALPVLEDGRQARFLFLPEGEDPDSMVRSAGAEGFQALLDSALPMEEFLFETVAEGIDTRSLDGRARMARLALPHVRRLPDGVFRELMLQELARRTGLELDSLLRLEAAAAEAATPPEPAPAAGTHDYPDAPTEPEAPPGDWPDAPSSGSASASASAAPGARRDAQPVMPSGYANIAQGAIALILHKPSVARDVDPAPLAESPAPDARLLRELIELVRLRPESNTGMLLGHWYGRPEGDLLARLAGQERLIPTEGIDRQFRDTLDALCRRLPQQTQLAAQVDKLKHTNYAEVSELEKQRLRELLQEKRRRDAERERRDI